MPRAIDPASLRAYMARDWRRARLGKRAYWRARLATGGLAAAIAISDQLRTGLQKHDASWPSEHDREEDLETHRRVAAALARTATAAPRPARRRAAPRREASRSAGTRRRAGRVR
jgi:hypothetical protein